MSLFDVEKKHIEQLNSEQLVRVLRKLLCHEANKFGIPQSAANVYLNTNSPDGGEDGRIKWENGPPKTDWIPNRFSIFQSKAKNMHSDDFIKEILDERGNVKIKVKEVLDANGSYIFFCHQASTGLFSGGKKKKIVNVLIKKGYPKNIEKQIEIYDGNIISNWVNQYFTAKVFVFELLGIRHQFQGLQTWEKWDARFPDKKYFCNDKLNGWIGEIRKTLAGSQKNVTRITGLSGLGKTRLALEVLRPPDNQNNIEQAGISDSVLYYEASSDESPIKQYITEYRNCKNVTFVIDECGPKLHSSIINDVLAEDSNINLITIFNEPDYDRVQERHKISLVPEDFKSVVKDILNNTYKNKLPDSDISKILEFAGGFPDIARRLADSRLLGGTSLELTDDNITRKILWGQKNEDDEKLSVLQACSIFKYFRLENEYGKIDEQAKFICDVVAIDESIKTKYGYFCSIIKEFYDRRIIQKHGRYYGIEPVPLALRLARQWWGRAMRGKIVEIIENVESKGLLESFCEQSRRFDFIPQAADLIEKICGPSCPFGNAEVVLSVAGSRIFRPFAEVNPKPVADCLFRILTSPEVKASNIVNDVRRNLVWAIERLCWHKETFGNAARILKILALAENESWSNNATGLFLQLFHIRLPGTLANLSQRQEIINDMIRSDDTEEKKLAVKAIENAFQSGHFTRRGGAESQGTRAPERDYYPTKEEVEKYWETNLEILTNLIISDGAAADEAKKVFANISGSLIRNGYVSDVEKSINKILQTGLFWHDMLVRVEKMLIREDNKYNDGIIERLKALSSSLEPQTWPDKIKHYISTPDWLHRKNNDGHYINLSDEKAEQLTDELSESDELWDLLSILYEGEQRQGFTFGKRLASKLKETSRFIKESLNILEKCQNPNILVLGSFLSGLNDSSTLSQVLSELSKSKKLVQYIPVMLQLTGAKKEHLDFILDLLKDQKLTVDNLTFLRFGSSLATLEPKEAMYFCEKVANFGVDGAIQAFGILYMYCFGTPGRFEQCREQFISIMTKNKLLSGNIGNLDIYTWSEMAKRYIPHTPIEFSEHICIELVTFCSSNVGDKYSAIRQLKDITAELLKHRHEIAWSYFGKALLDKNNWEVKFGIEHLLGVNCGDVKKEDESPLLHIPYDYLRNWCKQNAPEGPAVIMRLLPIVWEENDSNYGMDELSCKLLLDFGNYEKVQHAMYSQMFSFASCGSREPYYLRRINVLREFNKSVRDKSSKNWIDKIIDGLEKEAQSAKVEHDEDNAGILDR